MQYRTLGLTDLRVSALCLGSMQFGWTADEGLSLAILSAAFEAGINFIDSADIYSRWVEGNPGGVAEEIIGRWMKKSRTSRDRVILATKVRGNMGEGPDDEGLSPGHIIRAVENSLRRLGTDYIDLYQAHWPDGNIGIEETLRSFDGLVKAGKVRYFGASNYAAWELMQSLWASDKNGLKRYDSLQPHYNLVHRAEFERELAAVCRKYSLGVLPYSPLAGGFLTGKYRPGQQVESARAGRAQRYFSDRNWKLIGILESIGKAKNASISQVALAWLLSDPLVTSPIVGPHTLDQLADNLGSVDLVLTDEEKGELDNASAWKEIEP